LVLRRGGNITTNAQGSNIPGGNITIDTDNLVAVPKENSDISANSEESFGGRVIPLWKLLGRCMALMGR
jgi:large exoprotein involved in heme utilization and adhesion